MRLSELSRCKILATECMALSSWRQSPFKQKPLPVFNTSRGHQLTQTGAVVGEPHHRSWLFIKQSTAQAVKAAFAKCRDQSVTAPRLLDDTCAAYFDSTPRV
jgi:hypothetical protein